MKIKELNKDISRYLTDDCYCPNEIYGTDGFGYQLHYAEDECELFVETEDFVSCITEYAFGELTSHPQLLIFWKDNDGNIEDAVAYDATENNLKGLKKYVKTGDKFTEDHFNKDWNKGLKEILSLCNAVIID